MATIVITQVPELAKVSLAITFTNTAVTTCKVERRDPGMSWVPILGGSTVTCVAGKATIEDAEIPLDVEVTYRVTQVPPPSGSETGTATTTLASGGATWLKDPAYPTRNMMLREVTSLPELKFTSRAGVFSILDRPRPVVVAAKRSSWSGELTFHTSTDDERLRLYELLSRGQVLLLTTPANYGVGSVYLHVGDVEEERLGVVTEPTRRWTLPVTQVDRPASLSLPQQKMRWADVKSKYATWQALADTGMTWAQLLEKNPAEA